MRKNHFSGMADGSYDVAALSIQEYPHESDRRRSFSCPNQLRLRER
jgi:hypothetical protein